MWLKFQMHCCLAISYTMPTKYRTIVLPDCQNMLWKISFCIFYYERNTAKSSSAYLSLYAMLCRVTWNSQCYNLGLLTTWKCKNNYELIYQQHMKKGKANTQLFPCSKREFFSILNCLMFPAGLDLFLWQL